MKPIKFLYIPILYLVLTVSCSTSVKTSETVIYQDAGSNGPGQVFSITAKAGKGFNHPTFVIWEEDMMGNYIRTLFITKSYATGIYAQKMIEDSSWADIPGTSYQPASLPYWTYRKGSIDGNQLIPTPEHPFVDAYTGATPSYNFTFEGAIPKTKSAYRLLLEVNQTSDWNMYWTNNKYPKSKAYKNSAQPSLVYAVTINQEDSVYYLNPIGHGDPKGETGKLNTNLSTLSTALEIFNSIKVEIKP